MKLMNKELESIFKKVGSQEKVKDPIVIAKFFDPCGSGTWLALEYYPDEQTFFGYVMGLGENELGYFSLDELQNYKGKLGLGIERDLYFDKKPLSNFK